jgi:hypothetical protein
MSKVQFLIFLKLVSVMCSALAFDTAEGQVASVKVKQSVPLPDSLGGSLATGDVILVVYLQKSGAALGYDVMRIFVVTHPCSVAQYYGVGAPTVEEGRKRGTIQGQPVFERFREWIDKVYSGLEITVDTTHAWFDKSDTVTMTYQFDVNPELETHIDRILGDFQYEVPALPLPDSLGGSEAKGWIAVRLYLDSQAKIICWIPTWISVEDTLTNKIFYYSDRTLDPRNDDRLLKRFSQWLETYLKQVKFMIDRRHWYFKEMPGVTITVHLKLNSTRKVRRIRDERFLLDELWR